MPRPLYAIAMSGFGMGEDQCRSQKAGYRRHLLKPIKPEELGAALEEAARERVGSKRILARKDRGHRGHWRV